MRDRVFGKRVFADKYFLDAFFFVNVILFPFEGI